MTNKQETEHKHTHAAETETFLLKKGMSSRGSDFGASGKLHLAFEGGITRRVARPALHPW